MNTGDDEPSSGLNGRLRPRKSNPSPQTTKILRKPDTRPAQEKPKRTSTPSKASPNKPDDLTNKSDSPAPLLLCPYCDKTFFSKQAISKHIRRIHLSSSKQDSIINCLYCNHVEADANANDIIRHMVDNHPNQYFACYDCHTRFPSTTELAEHKLNVCEKPKLPYRNKLRQKPTPKKSHKSQNINIRDDFEKDNKNFPAGHGFNGIVISCELKPTHVHDQSDIEDNITTNFILPPGKSLVNATVIDKNAVIVLDDLQWSKRIPQNFNFHNTDADQILSRLGVVHRSPRTGDLNKKDWFRSIDESNQKFEKCFDTGFYSKVASNVQENLTKFLDGSFNFNPDPENTIKTRKAKNSVAINTAEGFPILLAPEQFSRNVFDAYMPRAIAPKHKWKWENLENDKNLLSPEQIKRDSHTNKCIISLVSSLDIWTQLCMRRKYEEKFNKSPPERKTEKQSIIGKELKEILESRELPTSSSQVVKYTGPNVQSRESSDFPASLGLVPSAPSFDFKPAVLSGEWVRPRCYVCCACGAQTRDSKALSSHISTRHPNAQIQHYEIVGEVLLNSDILKHLYVPPSQLNNRTRPLRGFRDCTKCRKSISLEDLHQHMLDCAGDTPAVRRKCRYRPFGVRKRRPRLPDNTIRKKMRKDIRSSHNQKNIMRPRPKTRSEVGDAETIRKMLADLPAKRHRVMVNPINPGLRPRIKRTTQRSKIVMKKRPPEDMKKKPQASESSKLDGSEVENPKQSSSNTKQLKKKSKTTLKRVASKILRRNDKNSTMTKTRRKTVKSEQPKQPKAKSKDPSSPSAQPADTEGNIQVEQLSIDNNPERININDGSSHHTREHGNSFNSGSNNRDNQRPGCSGQNNDSRDSFAPAPNVPLKHSIARLTASSETHDKSVQFHHLFLVQQECNNVTNHVPSGQRALFENEAVVTKLDKPPLHFNYHTAVDAQTLQKGKSNKPRKGLNDCIAMLKNKLVEPSSSALPGHVSVQCGSDEPLGPEPVIIERRHSMTDSHTESIDNPSQIRHIEKPLENKVQNYDIEPRVTRRSSTVRHGHRNSRREKTVEAQVNSDLMHWKQLYYDSQMLSMPRHPDIYNNKHLTRRRSMVPTEEMLLQHALNVELLSQSNADLQKLSELHFANYNTPYKSSRQYRDDNRKLRSDYKSSKSKDKLIMNESKLVEKITHNTVLIRADTNIDLVKMPESNYMHRTSVNNNSSPFMEKCDKLYTESVKSADKIPCLGTEKVISPVGDDQKVQEINQIKSKTQIQTSLQPQREKSPVKNDQMIKVINQNNPKTRDHSYLPTQKEISPVRSDQTIQDINQITPKIPIQSNLETQRAISPSRSEQTLQVIHQTDPKIQNETNLDTFRDISPGRNCQPPQAIHEISPKFQDQTNLDTPSEISAVRNDRLVGHQISPKILNETTLDTPKEISPVRIDQPLQVIHQTSPKIRDQTNLDAPREKTAVRSEQPLENMNQNSMKVRSHAKLNPSRDRSPVKNDNIQVTNEIQNQANLGIEREISSVKNDRPLEDIHETTTKSQHQSNIDTPTEISPVRNGTIEVNIQISPKIQNQASLGIEREISPIRNDQLIQKSKRTNASRSPVRREEYRKDHVVSPNHRDSVLISPLDLSKIVNTEEIVPMTLDNYGTLDLSNRRVSNLLQIKDNNVIHEEVVDLRVNNKSQPVRRLSLTPSPTELENTPNSGNVTDLSMRHMTNYVPTDLSVRRNRQRLSLGMYERRVLEDNMRNYARGLRPVDASIMLPERDIVENMPTDLSSRRIRLRSDILDIHLPEERPMTLNIDNSSNKYNDDAFPADLSGRNNELEIRRATSKNIAPRYLGPVILNERLPLFDARLREQSEIFVETDEDINYHYNQTLNIPKENNPLGPSNIVTYPEHTDILSRMVPINNLPESEPYPYSSMPRRLRPSVASEMTNNLNSATRESVNESTSGYTLGNTLTKTESETSSTPVPSRASISTVFLPASIDHAKSEKNDIEIIESTVPHETSDIEIIESPLPHETNEIEIIESPYDSISQTPKQVRNGPKVCKTIDTMKVKTQNKQLDLCHDSETARKIAMLPKELVEILGTMPVDHRNQLLNVLPQYVFPSTSPASVCNTHNSASPVRITDDTDTDKTEIKIAITSEDRRSLLNTSSPSQILHFSGTSPTSVTSSVLLTPPTPQLFERNSLHSQENDDRKPSSTFTKTQIFTEDSDELLLDTDNHSNLIKIHDRVIDLTGDEGTISPDIKYNELTTHSLPLNTKDIASPAITPKPMSQKIYNDKTASLRAVRIKTASERNKKVLTDNTLTSKPKDVHIDSLEQDDNNELFEVIDPIAQQEVISSPQLNNKASVKDNSNHNTKVNIGSALSLEDLGHQDKKLPEIEKSTVLESQLVQLQNNDLNISVIETSSVSDTQIKDVKNIENVRIIENNSTSEIETDHQNNNKRPGIPKVLHTETSLQSNKSRIKNDGTSNITLKSPTEVAHQNDSSKNSSLPRDRRDNEYTSIKENAIVEDTTNKQLLNKKKLCDVRQNSGNSIYSKNASNVIDVTNKNLSNKKDSSNLSKESDGDITCKNSSIETNKNSLNQKDCDLQDDSDDDISLAFIMKQKHSKLGSESEMKELTKITQSPENKQKRKIKRNKKSGQNVPSKLKSEKSNKLLLKANQEITSAEVNIIKTNDTQELDGNIFNKDLSSKEADIDDKVKLSNRKGKKGRRGNIMNLAKHDEPLQQKCKTKSDDYEKEINKENNLLSEKDNKVKMIDDIPKIKNADIDANKPNVSSENKEHLFDVSVRKDANNETFDSSPNRNGTSKVDLKCSSQILANEAEEFDLKNDGCKENHTSKNKEYSKGSKLPSTTKADPIDFNESFMRNEKETVHTDKTVISDQSNSITKSIVYDSSIDVSPSGSDKFSILDKPKRQSVKYVEIKESEEPTVTPLRRSRRGKSLFIDSNTAINDNSLHLDNVIEQRAPLTKKQLIFSKLLLDEENHNKPKFAVSPDKLEPQSLTIVDKTLDHHDKGDGEIDRGTASCIENIKENKRRKTPQSLENKKEKSIEINNKLHQDNANDKEINYNKSSSLDKIKENKRHNISPQSPEKPKDKSVIGLSHKLRHDSNSSDKEIECEISSSLEKINENEQNNHQSLDSLKYKSLIDVDNQLYQRSIIQKEIDLGESSADIIKGNKRKKSPQFKRKFKKKKSTETSSLIPQESDQTTEVKQKISDECQSENISKSFSPDNMVSIPNIPSEEKEIDSLLDEHTDTFKNYSDEKPESVEKNQNTEKALEKRKSSSPTRLESVQSTKPKKCKLSNDSERSSLNNILDNKLRIDSHINEKKNVTIDVKSTCYNKPARRARSKSVVVQSSGSDLYDPYDIDLEVMVDKAQEPFVRKDITPITSFSSFKSSLECKTRKLSKTAPSAIIDILPSNYRESTHIKSDAISVTDKINNIELNTKLRIESTENKEIISDSDESSKSDVPLKILAEEKEKKLAENTHASEHSRGLLKESIEFSEKTRDKSKYRKKGKRVPSVDIHKEESVASNKEDDEEELRSEQFMESFGFFSERKPRKSNLLATKKISETFHIIANENDDVYFSSKERTYKKSTSDHKKDDEVISTDSSIMKKSGKRGRKKKISVQTEPAYCNICKKSFRRYDNYFRHQVSLYHVSRLSEVEFKEKIAPIEDEPNYLFVLKHQMDKLRILQNKIVKRKKKGLSYADIILPTMEEILIEVKRIVREQQLSLRGLSRDEALFIDCCEMLKESHKNDIPTVNKKVRQCNNLYCEQASLEELILFEKSILDDNCDLKDDGDVDSLTAKNILESDEVRNLENDLISGLKEASGLNGSINFQNSLSTIQAIPQEHRNEIMLGSNVVELTNYQDEVRYDIDESNTVKSKRHIEVKDKMYPDVIENIDMFEDKFDKIKRKCRSQAAAAKQVQTQADTNFSHKSRRKSEKKKGKKSSKKSSSAVPTKGALKGFDGIKVSILTSEINMSAITPSVGNTQKRKKKSGSKKKRDRKNSDVSSKYDSDHRTKDVSQKKVDVYEFMDTEDTELFEFRPSTLMERFKSINNKDIPSTSKAADVEEQAEISSESGSDGDDFVYMSDDYVCSDDETENSILSCELSNTKSIIEHKKAPSPLKRKDVIEKNAVMGKIFKHNAVRSDRKPSKNRDFAKPKANLDQLFDSLLENEPKSTSSSNNIASPKKDDLISSNIHQNYKHDHTSSKYDDLNEKVSSETGPIKKPISSPMLIYSSSPRKHKSMAPIRKPENIFHPISCIDYGPSTSKQSDEMQAYIMRECIKPSLTVDALAKRYDDSVSNTKEFPSPKSDVSIYSKNDKHFYQKHKSRDISILNIKKRVEERRESYDCSVDLPDRMSIYDDAGVARQRARRKCTVGKQNVLAETWSSESEPDGMPPRPNSAESVMACSGRKKKGRKREGQSCGTRRGRQVSTKKHDADSRVNSNGRIAMCGEVSLSSVVLPRPRARPPRPVAHYWSEGEDEQEHPQQHGWIVGDSHKKLVTMLAHAKGRKRNHDEKRHAVD